MHPSLTQDIPEFLFDSIVYCDSLTYKRNVKSSFALTKNLKFYEFRKKQLLNSIDLSETSLINFKERILTYSGPKTKWSTYHDVNDQSTSSSIKSESAPQSFSKFDIKFGKYIYKVLGIKKLYLLVSCWDKLVVVYCIGEASPHGIYFAAEFENVESFKIVSSSTMKYQAALHIKFLNEKSICTDFEEEEYVESTESNALNFHLQKSECKKLFNRVQRTKAELQQHKEITNKLCQIIKNEQTFGKNLIRSTSLVEKPILTRCGDVWVRITCSEEILFGVPLVNNCAPPNLTILKNLLPVFLVTSPSMIEEKIPSSMQLKYRIYQLQQIVENLNTMESFFQAENEQFQRGNWVVTDFRILPSSYVVLLIKLNLSELTLINEECPLFIHFQIEKEFQTDELETCVFEQHLFIKTFDFQKILQERKKYEITFIEKTLHQDILSLLMVSFETQLQIDFETYDDQRKFEKLLMLRFDFEIAYRRSDNALYGRTSMEFDRNSNESKALNCTLFYNRNPRSVWFGSLIVRTADKELTYDNDTCRSHLAFYNKNQNNSILMFNLLLSELIVLKCNVVDIKNLPQCQNSMTRITNFEKALRQEIEETLNIAKNQYDTEILFQKVSSLLQLQYNTDTLSRAMD